jgi:hypothetical protein
MTDSLGPVHEIPVNVWMTVLDTAISAEQGDDALADLVPAPGEMKAWLDEHDVDDASFDEAPLDHAPSDTDSLDTAAFDDAAGAGAGSADAGVPSTVPVVHDDDIGAGGTAAVEHHAGPDVTPDHLPAGTGPDDEGSPW